MRTVGRPLNEAIIITHASMVTTGENIDDNMKTVVSPSFYFPSGAYSMTMVLQYHTVSE